MTAYDESQERWMNIARELFWEPEIVDCELGGPREIWGWHPVTSARTRIASLMNRMAEGQIARIDEEFALYLYTGGDTINSPDENKFEYDNLSSRLRDLEETIREWENDGVFSGDRGYQRMLEERDDILDLLKQGQL